MFPNNHILMFCFQSKKTEELNQLYDRIADSFVALFTSIHKDVKDKFLSVSMNVACSM